MDEPRTVTLDPEFDDLVRAEVESGRHADVGSVVREALRLLTEDRRALEALRAEVTIGIAEADAGLFSTLTSEELLAELCEEARREASQAPS